MLPETERPLPYMTAPAWLPLLEELAAALAPPGRQNSSAGGPGRKRPRERGSAFLLNSWWAGSPWAAHALGLLLARQGNGSLQPTPLCWPTGWRGDRLDPSFAEQALNALVRAGRLQEAWQLWQALPPRHQTETGRLTAAQAAVALSQDAFVEDCFTRDHACIREGRWGLRTCGSSTRPALPAGKGRALHPAAIDYSLPLPRELDFRMFGA